jgi:CxxC motif-containing protein (DUF1111 family)
LTAFANTVMLALKVKMVINLFSGARSRPGSGPPARTAWWALVAVAIPVAVAAAGCGDDSSGVGDLIVVGEDPSDLPLRGLGADEMVRFDRGDALFEQPFRDSQGLGPLYIRHACSSCHAADGKGPGAVTKMAPPTAGPPLEFPYGQTVRPQVAGGATQGIDPVEGARTSVRIGPAVFGRGYIEAISDAEIERVAAEQAAAAGQGAPVSGRIHRVAFQSEANPDTRFPVHQRGEAGLIGRFGLKARIATVDDFSADAFQGDMGITSPLRPAELPNPEGLIDDGLAGTDVTAETVNLVADYIRALAIPRRSTPAAAAGGAALFADSGCASCHVPALRTRADYPLAQLADIDSPVYSDLLLHDMGSDLADGITDGDASGSEWRTAPLMGLRFFSSYLHDGRAKTLRQAVMLHAGPGSEASDSVGRFTALDAAAQERLLAFLATL